MAFTLLATCLLLSGCGVHNAMNLQARAESVLLATNRPPPHHRKVFLTESRLPTNFVAQVVARIDAGEVTTESTESVLIRMANQARAAGADAVMDLNVWRQGSGFSWLAPQASGTAVTLANTNVIQIANGYWY